MGRAGIEPATLGLKVRLDKLYRAAANGNVLQTELVHRCNELQQNAACGDEPVLALYTHGVGCMGTSRHVSKRNAP
jgi:hypothetical protein